MRAVLLNPAGRHSLPPLLQALRRGLELRGFSITVKTETRRIENLDAFDLAACSGLHNISNLRGSSLSAGLPLLVGDLGYFKRANNGAEVESYFQLGWNTLCDIPSSAPSTDRWEALQLEVEPEKVGGSYILVLDQVGGDKQHGLSSRELGAWLLRKAEAERKRTKLPILWRPHPKQNTRPPGVPHGIALQNPSHVSLASALDGAAKAVTYNSTAGLEAVRRGIPVECHPRAHFFDVCGTSQAERLLYMQRVAYAQWLLEEMRNGAALDFLLGRLQR